MQPEVQVLLSSALTFGVPLVLAVRELLVLHREGPRRGGDPQEPMAPLAPDDDSSLPPLPACLIPGGSGNLPMATRRRVLEDA